MKRGIECGWNKSGGAVSGLEYVGSKIKYQRQERDISRVYTPFLEFVLRFFPFLPLSIVVFGFDRRYIPAYLFRSYTCLSGIVKY